MSNLAGGIGSIPQQRQQQHWAALLAEAAANSKGQPKLKGGTVLFLGDAVGKTRLVKRFCAPSKHADKEASMVGEGIEAGRATMEEEKQECLSAGREECSLPLLSYSYFDAPGGARDERSSSGSNSGRRGSAQTSERGTSPATRLRRNNDIEAGGSDDDDDMESAARINIWSLSDPSHKTLLQVAFNASQEDCCDKEAGGNDGDQSTKTGMAREGTKAAARDEALQRTVCMIGVDLTQPWTCEAALQRWVGVLKAVLAEAGCGEGGRGGVRQGDREEDEEEIMRKARLAAYLSKCYDGSSTSMQWRQQKKEQPQDEQQQQQQQEDEEGKDGDKEVPVFRVHKSSPLRRRTVSSQRSSPSSLPPGVLTENLGVPLIVVGLQADLVHAPDSFEDEQRSQFLQQYLRSFCLKHGAALVYVSATRDTNCLLLQHYILHRLYPELFPFSLHAQARRRETLFVPAGWDSEEIVRKLLSPQSLPWPASATFSQILVPPKGVRMPVVGEEEEEEEKGNEQGSKEDASPTRAWLEELLVQQQQRMQRLDVAGENIEIPAGSTATTPRTTGEDKGKASSRGASKGSTNSSSSSSSSKSNTGSSSTNSSSTSSSRSKPTPSVSSVVSAAVAGDGGGGSDKAQIRNFFEGLLAGGGASGVGKK